jgi:hypothetical protein
MRDRCSPEGREGGSHVLIYYSYSYSSPNRSTLCPIRIYLPTYLPTYLMPHGSVKTSAGLTLHCSSHRIVVGE